MLRYLARRLAASALILLGVSIVTFGLTFLIPADPVRMIAGRSASPQAVENIRHQLGLDQPVPVQYARYLGKLVQGDLGRSYVQKAEVSELIASRLPATLLLMAGAIFFELLIGLPAGILAVTQRGKWLDRGVMIVSFAGVSAPQFVVGLLLLYVFANLLGWFPLSGFGTLGHLILPALTLGIAGGGWYSRMMRSSIEERSIHSRPDNRLAPHRKRREPGRRLRRIDGRHLQGRHQHLRPGDRLRLAELVHDQESVRRPDGLRTRHDGAVTGPCRELRHLRGRPGLHVQSAQGRQVP